MITATATRLKLYRPETVCSNWPAGGLRYRGVRVTWLMWHRSEPIGDYRQLLDGYHEFTADDGRKWVVGQDVLDELFTADEAALLADYLKTAYGEDVTLVEVPLPVVITDPVVAGYMAYSSTAFGGSCDLHMLWEERGYTLPFQVGGFYDLERDLDAVVIKRLVRCPHHGEEWIDVSPCDPINHPRPSRKWVPDEVPF